MVNGIGNNPFKIIDYSIKNTMDTEVSDATQDNQESESKSSDSETKKYCTESKKEIDKQEALVSKQNLVKIDFEKVLKDEKNKTKDTKNIFSQTSILKDTVDKEADILSSLKTAVNEAIDEVSEDINTAKAKKTSIWDHLLHKVVSHAPVKPVVNTGGGDTGSTYVPEESVSVDESDFAVSEDSVSSASFSDSSSAISSASDSGSYSSSAEVAVYVED